MLGAAIGPTLLVLLNMHIPQVRTTRLVKTAEKQASIIPRER